MPSQNAWMGITIGVFVAGFFVGGSVFGIFSTTVHQSPLPVETVMLNPQMMNDPEAMQQWHQQMMQNPQAMNQWMNTTMNDPQLREQMYDAMLQHNQFMQGMMNNPDFQNHWMGYMNQGMMGSGMMGTNQFASQHLKTFDELDFVVFTNQEWERLDESHSQDVIVHWPDGRTTVGIEPHIEDLKAMFVYAPDTRIEQHPIKIASGKWTSVIGVIEGTFSEPMLLPDGSSIPPTGKSFNLTMATVGYWENGVMTEEYLFWDNLEFMKQIGLA